MKRPILAVILLVVVVAICGGLIWFNFMRAAGINAYFAKMRPPPVTVSSMEVKATDWTPGIDTIGTLSAAQGVDVAVEVGGIIKSINFKANEKIAAGQLLVQIDDAIDRAGLEGAQSSVALNRDALKRTETLSKRSVLTVADLQSAQNKLDQALSTLHQIEATIDLKALKAPFAGTIGIARVDVGQYVQPGTVVATLQNLDSMKVAFTLPEQALPHISIGQSATFGLTVDTMRFHGKITGIDPKIDPVSRLVSIEAVITKPDGTLRPGQFVHVRVIEPTEANIIAVPQTAVVTSLFGSFVYTIEPEKAQDNSPAAGNGGATTGDGAAPATPSLVAHQVFVKTGRRIGGEIEITDGLKPGMTIATAGQNKLSNGSSVVINNSVQPTVTDGAQAQAQP